MLQNCLEDSGKRRGRMEIVAGILEAAKEGVMKTQIMYQVNLSFSQLTGYVDFLVKSGLIQTVKKKGRVLYKTTNKGILFLKSYRELKQFLTKNSENIITSMSKHF